MKTRISLGNKVIGLISFVSVIFFAIIFSVYGNGVPSYIVSFVMIAYYSIQMNYTSYLSLENKVIKIENLFRGTEFKKVDTYLSCSKIGFGNIMVIRFSDNTKYFFWGKSVSAVEKVIRDGSPS